MVKHKKYIKYEMQRYPEKCKECPAFKRTPYSCHNERGVEGGCELGYMNGKDMRDFTGNIRFSNCNIENNEKVIINKLL